MSVLIVGAGIVGYGCAYSALLDGFDVTVVDHSIEFGLPNVWPSILLSKESIPLEFSTDQNFEGTQKAHRHEWIMKSMSIELAKKGCHFLHKTRINHSERKKNGTYSVEFVGAGQVNGTKQYQHLIDATQDTWIPWATPHQITKPSSQYNVERQEATGFVHLDTSTSDFQNPIYQINRQDGLIESWFSGNPNITNRKTIEIISTMLPTDHSLWDCSHRFQTGMNLWNILR